MAGQNVKELCAIDLFSGIGGWAIACHATGIRTLCFVEKDPRCQSFLGKAWPGIPIHPDIKTFEGKSYRGRADIIFGGVPCQPASRAGKQQGAADHRWLWGEALRVVAEVRPRVCLFENPPGIEDVGLDGILAALESQGYEIAPVFDIPACAVNSPQLRHRYYILAVARCVGSGQEEPQRGAERGTIDRRVSASASHVGLADMSKPGRKRPNPEQTPDGCGAECVESNLANDLRSGIQNSVSLRARRSRQGKAHNERALESGDMGNSARDESEPGGTQSGKREMVLSGAWDHSIWLPCADGQVRRAPDDTISLVDGLHRSVLGALGNSQVPQVAEILCRAIVKALT